MKIPDPSYAVPVPAYPNPAFPIPNIQNTFNGNDPKYQCCCGCHVKCGTWSIGILGCVSLACTAIWCIWHMGNEATAPTIYYGVMASLQTAAVIFILMGLSNENGRLFYGWIMFYVSIYFIFPKNTNLVILIAILRFWN